jgi:hypothetical protein
MAALHPSPPRRIIRVLVSLRAEMLAAIASAIAAGFSAYAAIHTFGYLERQENILRQEKDVLTQQLEATYLSNLYNKQVESIATLESAIFTFAKLTFADHLIPADQLKTNDIAAFEKTISGRHAEYLKAGLVINNAVNAVDLVAPSELTEQAISVSIVYYTGIVAAIQDFKESAPNQDSWKVFVQKLSYANSVVDMWDDVVLPCMARWLGKGKPITTERVEECHIGTVPTPP